ncbi:hypothetical protein [Thiomonas sp.]
MGGALLPTASGGFKSVHATLTQSVAALVPNPPRWVGVALGVGGFASAVADVFLTRQINRPAADASELYDRIGEVYRKAREGMAGAPVVVSAPATAIAQAPVTVNIVNSPAAAPSKYLAQEGAEDIDTGCLPCGKAHLGAMQGMLERAAQAAQAEGACGAECGQWVARAAQEPVALFARDWTPERIAKTPPEHRVVLEKYVPEVRQVQDSLVGGDEVRASLVRASALLSEATRFAGAGDGIQHPEVQWRLAEAEKDLTVAERARVAGMDPETQQRLRRLRQQAYNAVQTPDDLNRVAAEADAVAAEAQGAYAATLGPAQVQSLADSARRLRESFRADLSATEKGGAA